MNRRTFVTLAGGVLAATLTDAHAQNLPVLARNIPGTAEHLPVLGMGTWLTFDAHGDFAARAPLRDVLQTFFDSGGRLIDSSPMYGSSEEVVGDLLPQVRGGAAAELFSATKVWTYGEFAGAGQMEKSRELWRVPKFDLVEVHNMMDWRVHLKTLQRMKAEGRLRYIGITTSHGSRHEEMEMVIRTQPFDFVQFTYNLADRSAEARLLPLALEKGKAVIANRPLDGGNLFARVRGVALPAWAREAGCASWAEVFLTWVVSHPAVTCAIPATSKAAHMRENMAVLRGRLMDRGERQRAGEMFARI